MAVNQLPELLQDLKQLQADLTFNGPSKASQEIIKDLQGLSPAWTGKFRNSWRIKSPDGKEFGGGGQSGKALPVVGPTITGAKTTFAPKGSFSVFVIDNSSPYADQATDLEPFRPTSPLPARIAKTGFSKFGIRPLKGRRGEVEGVGDGPNSSSAPLDWFRDYTGSRLNKAVERAYSRRFRGFRR
jgi:hypothetical protein|tara:strand:- start:945 stop:1499 length:555 start_codon:yes stop_codon:yes gene_type:complete